jgi:hypothetical protein
MTRTALVCDQILFVTRMTGGTYTPDIYAHSSAFALLRFTH